VSKDDFAVGKASFLDDDDENDPEDAEIRRLEKLLGVSGADTKEAAREFADGDAQPGGNSED